MVAPGAAVRRSLVQRARPLRLTGRGRWLILAPHPDDETLGMGGLIARLAAAGTAPIVAFLTDGSGSHTNAPGWTPQRIASLRRAEAHEALRDLGVTTPAVQLGWADANPHSPESKAFARSVRQLTSLCRRHHVRHLAVTWPGEPHCDHEGAASLAQAVAQSANLQLHHYLVWGWTRPDLAAVLGPVRTHRIRTSGFRPAQRRALSRHRSQRGGRILGGTAFRLPRSMQALVDQPFTLLLEPPRAPRTIHRA